MKLAKLSLAAIMAVGALSTANAQSLEEAIKGVDFSGSIAYTTSVRDINNADGDSNNDWDIGFKFVVPVADNVKATIGAGTDAFNTATTQLGDVSNRAGARDQGIAVKDLYFTYAKNALTLKAGYQYLPTPFTDESGNGLVAMYNLGKVTLAGGYFANTEDQGGSDVAAVAVIGSFGVANAQVWAAQVPGVVDRIFFVQVDGSVAGASLTAQYINTKLDVVNAQTGDFFAIKAGYSMNNFGLSAVYTKNDTDQPVHALANDGDNKVIAAGYRIVPANNGYANYESTYGVEGKATFGSIGIKAGYAVGNNTGALVNGTNDVDEMYAVVSYAYSKNLTSYIAYSTVNDDTNTGDYDFYRFNAKYSF